MAAILSRPQRVSNLPYKYLITLSLFYAIYTRNLMYIWFSTSVIIYPFSHVLDRSRRLEYIWVIGLCTLFIQTLYFDRIDSIQRPPYQRQCKHFFVDVLNW